MVPLETNRRILTWLCVYPADKNTSKWQKRGYAVFSAAVVFMNCFGFTVSSAFYLKFASTDPDEAIFAIIQMPASAYTIYISIATIILRQKITDIFQTLSTIYEMCR